MSLIWKLLRQHISLPQFIGFFFANLVGLFIVMLGFQFYRDVKPVFNSDDSIFRNDYLIVSKHIGMGSTLSGRAQTFSQQEFDEFGRQPFVSQIGSFTSRQYMAEAQMSISGTPVLHSDLPLESVPDSFVDISLSDWKYIDGSHEVPIVLPRNYLSMYNFGYAQSHNLPMIGESTLSMVDILIHIHGNGLSDDFKGHVMGFSSRLNSILVPESFLKWSNSRYAPKEDVSPNRLVVKVNNPADEAFVQYLEDNGYEVENEKLQSEKATYFLRLVVSIVMIIGLIISVLSFYILMLSIYLLVQKNQEKLENLLLIGYTPARVAWPYQSLTLILNALVLVLSAVILFLARSYYLDVIQVIAADVEFPSILPALLLGVALFAIVTMINFYAIRKKVYAILYSKR